MTDEARRLLEEARVMLQLVHEAKLLPHSDLLSNIDAYFSSHQPAQGETVDRRGGEAMTTTLKMGLLKEERIDNEERLYLRLLSEGQTMTPPDNSQLPEEPTKWATGNIEEWKLYAHALRSAYSAKVRECEGMVLVPRERNYDQRIASLRAFNQCGGDLDDKLEAAHKAMLTAAEEGKK